VVYSFLDRLRQSKRPFFDLVERDPVSGQPAAGADGIVVKSSRMANCSIRSITAPQMTGRPTNSTLRLPLPEGRRIQFTK